MATTQLPIQGVFDKDTGALVGFAPAGSSTVAAAGSGVDSIQNALLDYSKSFDAITYQFKTLQDFVFGTRQFSPNGTLIQNTTDLAKYFDYWAYNLSGPTATINNEVQRYVDFTNAENFVFTSNALELRATLPNGTQTLATTTLSAAASYTDTITVADASAISVGQIVSLGTGQHANVHCQASFGVRGTFTDGGAITQTFNFATAMNQAKVVITVPSFASDTAFTLAQRMVDAINADSTLQSYKISAKKLSGTTGGTYIVCHPRLATSLETFGDCAKGSVSWVYANPSVSGSFTHEKKHDYFMTFVVAKSGNTLTLSHPITAASGATLYINGTKTLWRTDMYTAGSTSFNVPDTTGMSIGQGVSFSYQDSNIRYITALTGTSYTVNATVYATDGVLMPVYPIWMAKPSVNSTGTSITIASANLSSSVRAGMQIQAYGSNPNHNIKVVSVTPSGGSVTVVVSQNMSVTTSTVLMFYEPVQSSQIWSKFGVAPGADGTSVIALECEMECPDIGAVGAWPAFWLFSDPTNPTGLPAGGNSEIDMLEQFNYFGNQTAGDYRPSAPTSDLYSYAKGKVSPVAGNDNGGRMRKIQVVYTTTKTLYYLDGVLMFARTFAHRNNNRAQVAVNLAVGSFDFTSNGFFPLDQSQFPMAVKIKRLRVMAA